jgi:hypothetical protein
MASPEGMPARHLRIGTTWSAPFGVASSPSSFFRPGALVFWRAVTPAL